MNVKAYKVLYDITYASSPMSGISQEARLMFNMFAKCSQIDVAALIMQNGFRSAFNLKHDEILNQAHFIYRCAQSNISYKHYQESLPTRLSRLVETALSSLTSCKDIFFRKQFSYKELKHITLISDSIWRVFFKESLAYNNKDNILSKRFFASNLNASILSTKSKLGLAPPLQLIPNEYDFAIIQGVKKVNLPKQTIKINRYIDSLPIEVPDTLANKNIINNYLEFIRYIEKKSIICCITNQVKKTLLEINPNIKEENTFVIPVNIQKYCKNLKTSKEISDILKTRVLDYWVKKIPKYLSQNNFLFSDYIISISTIEPRKNYITLINAWKRYRYTNNKDLKLIIVGSLGWKYDEIVRTMLPEIMKGDLFSVSSLTQYELEILLSNAKANVFISQHEGFGCAPLEAMQCECPTLTSDINTHREVYGDATLYCNPYSENDIADKLSFLLADKTESEKLRRSLIKKGLSRSKLYYNEALMPKWIELFDILEKRKKYGKIYY